MKTSLQASDPGGVVESPPGFAPKAQAVVSVIANIAAAISGVALVLMQAHLLGNAISRFAGQGSWPATIEIVSHWWMPAVGLLALALAQVRGEHIEVTILTELLPQRYARASARIVQVISLIVALGITYFSWESALQALAIKQEVSGVVSIPIWPVAFLLPLSMIIYAAAIITTRKTRSADAVAQPAPANQEQP